ncbi:hypothetical protein RF11_11702 [Thelohanellus kitauei]|uniref:Integrase catalytic domain-containing protein n=1 Tax=Thelohanellus kitauei TaxID=669202 RepID=A0A0C2N8W5_THEKT|nr:hypothetical protein RF11_11702 [Thelohanellus kitauei]
MEEVPSDPLSDESIKKAQENDLDLRPFQIIAADSLGPWPPSKSGKNYIFVVMNYFSKWMEAYSLPNINAETISQKLIDELFADSDAQNPFTQKTSNVESKHLRSLTSPYPSHSDMTLEILRRILFSMLPKRFDSDKKWEEGPNKVLVVYRSCVHKQRKEFLLPDDISSVINKSRTGYHNIRNNSHSHAQILIYVNSKFQKYLVTNIEKVNNDPYKSCHFESYRVLWLSPREFIEKVSDKLYKVDCGRIIDDTILKKFKIRKELFPQVNDSAVQESNGRRPTREHKKAWWCDHIMTQLNNCDDYVVSRSVRR